MQRRLATWNNLRSTLSRCWNARAASHCYGAKRNRSNRFQTQEQNWSSMKLGSSRGKNKRCNGSAGRPISTHPIPIWPTSLGGSAGTATTHQLPSVPCCAACRCLPLFASIHAHGASIPIPISTLIPSLVWYAVVFITPEPVVHPSRHQTHQPDEHNASVSSTHNTSTLAASDQSHPESDPGSLRTDMGVRSGLTFGAVAESSSLSDGRGVEMVVVTNSAGDNQGAAPCPRQRAKSYT